MARQSRRVIVLEKEQYPFHKVCGEYISLESWDFLKRLGLELEKLGVPIITQLQLSSVSGRLLQQKLPLGGFGISRYLLDYSLAEIARSAGVMIKENSKVNEILFSGEAFTVQTQQHNYTATIVCCSYGKRSNLDVKWKRPFCIAAKSKLNNYVGIKYHIKADFPADAIALHHFKNGYCGIVKVEDDKYNLCYLATANDLQKAKGNIKEMEQSVLAQNPRLKQILAERIILYESPLTISQISFDKKKQVENHVLMVGDAAGMITPLCGNGMSMALHASKLAAQQVEFFLQGRITRKQMENQYTRKWQQHFSHRLRTGRMVQRLFTNKWLVRYFIDIARSFPGFLQFVIRQTHGKPF